MPAKGPLARMLGLGTHFLSGIAERTSTWGPVKRFRHYKHWQDDRRAEHWSDRDQETNARGRLPDDERVDLPIIWVTELYTPSQVDGLVEGIRSLGWDRDSLRHENLVEWTSNVRQGRHAGWINLGVVTRQGDNKFLGSDRKAELPTGIRAAFPLLTSLTSGVTALVIGFVLDEPTATSLNESLRREYTTRTSPSRRSNYWDVLRHILLGSHANFGYQISDPDGQRHQAVAAQISLLEQPCLNWLHASLPGVFAKALTKARPATAILLVTERAAAAEVVDTRNPGLDALELRSFDSWECADWPGIRMVLPMFSKGGALRATIVCRRHDAFPKRDHHHDECSNWTIAFRAHERMDALLSRWALAAMLDGYHEVLSALRDSVAGGRSFHSARHLRDLQELVRSTLYDVAIAAAEAKEFATARAAFERDLPALTRAKWGNRPASSSETLSKRLCRWIDYRCDQIVRNASALQATLSTTSNLTQAIENIRLQRIALILAVASTVIALVSLFISLKPP